MKNRIDYQETIQGSIERIPFLKKFLFTNIDNNKSVQVYAMGINCPFDILKINKYMGYDLIKKNENIKSNNINKLLKEAEKRGDIK